ncbi:5667_t:CDS:1, partial [Racocetra fulgida]
INKKDKDIYHYNKVPNYEYPDPNGDYALLNEESIVDFEMMYLNLEHQRLTQLL